MPTFNIVNYSLRPNKGIQRSIVFEGLQEIIVKLGIENCVYIGFGSVWFMDFVSAHKMLNIDQMISIEVDDVGYKRAEFNKPYNTVKIMHGLSTEILEELTEDDKLCTKQWIVWLDYDSSLGETIVDDIRLVTEKAPPNSVLLATFNAEGKKYGKPNQRAKRIKAILGNVVPDDLTDELCNDSNIQNTLTQLTTDFITSTALKMARPGGFEPAFKIKYADGAKMVTVGGILPAPGAVSQVRFCVKSSSWRCEPDMPITTPLLTLKESSLLQAKLPRKRHLTRATVNRMGFDLEEEQIKAYEEYYKYYPSFARIMS